MVDAYGNMTVKMYEVSTTFLNDEFEKLNHKKYNWCLFHYVQGQYGGKTFLEYSPNLDIKFLG